ncbi:MAG: hypothetical protein AAFX06_33160 [Planctomycetota bacterium]
MRSASGLHRRGELRFVERAVNQDWDMSEAERLKAVALCHEVLYDDDATERESLAAVRVILAMDRANTRAIEAETRTPPVA